MAETFSFDTEIISMATTFYCDIEIEMDVAATLSSHNREIAINMAATVSYDKEIAISMTATFSYGKEIASV